MPSPSRRSRGSLTLQQKGTLELALSSESSNASPALAARLADGQGITDHAACAGPRPSRSSWLLVGARLLSWTSPFVACEAGAD